MAWCWGADGDGQLGNGAAGPSSTPVAVDTPTGVTFTAIEVGYDHTCALDTQGSIWCWGLNTDGQLGIGVPGPGEPSPLQVEKPAGLTFTDTSLGWNHTCALDNEGRAWCWGSNLDGQLGYLGSDSDVPVQVDTDVRFETLDLGSIHSCGIDSSGTAWCWGGNGGALGDGTAASRPTPGEVHAPPGVTFASISGGEEHTCGLDTTDVAWCWGYNESGRLGDGTITQRLTPVEVIGFP
jgi:alpha-tubulin suppressor-like RCC1 family protein